MALSPEDVKQMIAEGIAKDKTKWDRYVNVIDKTVPYESLTSDKRVEYINKNWGKLNGMEAV